jgi:pyruvate/2-oxoglutarate dehydrogenase complex dihydrolipoamide dehydrogenase (E3) component
MSEDTVRDPVESWDVVILGSGEAGKYLAWRLGAEGRRVALVERQYMGGSCPNIACLPSKNVIHSAKVAWYVRHAVDYGVKAKFAGIDMHSVTERKWKMVSDLVTVHENRFTQSGVTFIWGEGQFLGPRVLQVTPKDGPARLLRGDVVVLSTGSRAAIPDIPGLLAADPMTHVGALEMDEVPRHLVILGAGFIALEFAQAMRRFGAEVTVISRSASLLPAEDEDVSAVLRETLEKDGVQFLFSSTLQGVSGHSGEALELEVHGQQETSQLKATHLLVATGRQPNTGGIGLDVAGVELTSSGHIKVNQHLETSAEKTYAVGDCAGSPNYTHIAYDDHRVVFDAIHGGTRSTTGRQVPYCLFTDPEVAHVGLREREATTAGIPYRLAKLPIAAALRTRTLGETQGFFKALVGEDDRILGFTAVGTGTGELLAAVQVAMAAKLPYTALREAVFTHPTLNEGLVYLFSAVKSR